MVPYPEEMVRPMREELVRIGVRELTTPEEVDGVMADRTGSVLVFVNSVCGCAAGNARPALALCMTHDPVPERVVSVFAGQDVEATARARGYFAEHPPTSPAFALFVDGRLVHLMQRRQIEGVPASQVSANLTAAFDRYCRAPR